MSIRTIKLNPNLLKTFPGKIVKKWIERRSSKVNKETIKSKVALYFFIWIILSTGCFPLKVECFYVGAVRYRFPQFIRETEISILYMKCLPCIYFFEKKKETDLFFNTFFQVQYFNFKFVKFHYIITIQLL